MLVSISVYFLFAALGGRYQRHPKNRTYQLPSTRFYRDASLSVREVVFVRVKSWLDRWPSINQSMKIGSNEADSLTSHGLIYDEDLDQMGITINQSFCRWVLIKLHGCCVDLSWEPLTRCYFAVSWHSMWLALVRKNVRRKWSLNGINASRLHQSCWYYCMFYWEAIAWGNTLSVVLWCFDLHERIPQP